MAFLTKEECVRRHRLLWNWIADETEKTGEPINKSDAFKHFGWDEYEVRSSCWCCEWVYSKWKWNLDFDGVGYKLACSCCPLDWSNGEKKILEADCRNIRTSDGHIGLGLFQQWVNVTFYEKDPIKASKIARIIANLPEKKEVKEDD